MPNNVRPKALFAGKVYGQCTFWIGVVGLAIGLIGMTLSFAGVNPYFDNQALLDGLWAGHRAPTIWAEATGREFQPGHWYLGRLGFSDGVAMLGIAIACLAAVIGIWAATLGMVMKKREPRFFVVLGFILALLLTLSVTGILSG